MNTWLAPLRAASEGQRRDLDKLQNAVQTCLANYEIESSLASSALDRWPSFARAINSSRRN